MRIDALRLIAFGAFAGKDLDLSAGNQGLHVIHGPNEAGKSTALRALTALLYGIPGQTPDDFVHPYDKLRVGGRLRLRSGQVIDVVRRKGNKGTLRDPADAPIDDHALDRFVDGVDQTTFVALWGIDHARLVAGGEEILAQKGALAESLFAAGLGFSRLSALRDALDGEARAIFAPQAQNPSLNAALRTLHNDEKALREATVSADEWEKREKRVRDAEVALANATEAHLHAVLEQRRLERLRRVLPHLDERAAHLERLVPVRDCLLLPSDFAERLREARAAFEAASERLGRAQDDLARDTAELEALGAPSVLVAVQAAVAELLKDLGSHRTAMTHRPGLVERRDEQRAVAARILADLRGGLEAANVERLRAFVGRRSAVQVLATQRGALDERLAGARRRIDEAAAVADSVATEKDALPAPRDGTALQAALREVQTAGNLVEIRARARADEDRLRTECAAAASRLGLSEAELEPLAAMPVPSPDAIARSAARETEIEGRRAGRRRDRERIERDLRNRNLEIEAFRRQGDVPTEADLGAARMRRDASFDLLVAKWERGEDVTAQVRSLLGEGEPVPLHRRAVEATDGTADRLRREAGRVATLVELERARSQLVAERAALTDAETEDAHDATVLAEEWAALWSKVPAHRPRAADAAAWRADFDRLADRVALLVEARHQEQIAADRERSLRASLASALAALGEPVRDDEPLGAVTVRSERALERMGHEAGARIDHERRALEAVDAIDGAKRDEKAALQATEAWCGRWAAALAGFTDRSDTLPEEVLTSLERADRAIAALDAARGLQERIDGIDQDAREFVAHVRELAARLGETTEVEPQGEGAWVEGAQRRIVPALAEERRRAEFRSRVETLAKSVANERDVVGRARASMTAFLAEARCASEENVPSVIQQSAERRAAEEGLRGVERSIAMAAEGVPSTDLEREAAAEDRATLDYRIDEYSHRAADLSASRDRALQEHADARTALRQIEGQGGAAERAEIVASTLARVQDLASHFARLRLAAVLLDRQIEAFRRDHQTPMLRRAGELFSRITCGSFDRLEADVDDGQPVIVGVRPDGSRVHAAGMSDGTHDQLFLALRLAAVEAACAKSEPLPFVVDDVLVKFDDERSAATVAVLADLAHSTQVVLFTHHGRVADAARSLGPARDVHVHEL